MCGATVQGDAVLGPETNRAPPLWAAQVSPGPVLPLRRDKALGKPNPASAAAPHSQTFCLSFGGGQQS